MLVLQEQARTVTTPRTCSTPASAMGSPDITRYEYRKAGTRTTLTRKTFGLPPPQLSNVHLHSQALKPVYAHDQGTYAADDLEESVGSISGGNVRGHDDYDSGDEQESGLYSPDTSTSDSLPSGNAAGHERKANEELYDARRRLPLMADPVEVEDYYDGPLSRKNSFGKKGTPRREISGRWDTLNRKEDTSQERKENAGSRQSSIDQRDIRQGAYTGSGRFDPYYGRREDPLERHVAYTGSEKLDPDYGRSSMKVSRGPSGDVQPSEDQNLTSATELSEDDIDSDEDDHSDEDRLQRSSGKQQGAGYPKIEGYTPFVSVRFPISRNHSQVGKSLQFFFSVIDSSIWHVGERISLHSENCADSTFLPAVDCSTRNTSAGAELTTVLLYRMKSKRSWGVS